MADRLDLGISGLEVGLGDHLCGLYAGERQRDELVIPFLEAGLRRGDKCICIIDGTDPAKIVAALGSLLDRPGGANANQLEVMRAADVYLRSGYISPVEVISVWKAAISGVMYEGRFDVIRAVQTWSQREVAPPTEQLVALESQLNRYLPLYPQVIICLYDLEQLGSGLVVDLLKTHPKVLLGNNVLENPYWLSPDELLAVASDAQRDTLCDEREEAAAWCYAATTGST